MSRDVEVVRACQHSSTLVTVLLSIVAVIALLLTTCGTAAAQATSGTMTGVVTDPSGAVVPNANVVITDTQHGSSVTTTTNAEGLFTRTQLANSTYDVKVSASGFQTVQQNGITVNIDRETRINITLRPGQVQQAVQVVADQVPVLVTD